MSGLQPGANRTKIARIQTTRNREGRNVTLNQPQTNSIFILQFTMIELDRFSLVRPRTHGLKKVPEYHKFDSNLAQNPLF